MACSVTHFYDCPGQWLGDAANGVADSALNHMSQAVQQAVGTAMGSLGTLWTKIGTPDLTGGPSTSAVAPGMAGPGALGITSALGDVMWVSIVVAVVSLVILGALMAVRMRRGDGIAAMGRIGLILASVVMISAASALVTGLMPAGPSHVGGTVLFLQDSLWWYMGAAAVLSVIIGGAKMAWEQRAEPGRDVLKSLLTLIVVAGAGVAVIGLLVQAADGFSTWIIGKSLDCTGTSGNATCFGHNMSKLLIDLINPVTGAGGLGVLLIIVMGLFALLASVIQMALMVARGGMLVLLAGFLPLSASFTNTATGQGWFRKCVAWTIAFILYKPAAAIVYAAAFQLVGQIDNNGTPLLSITTGLMLMALALLALPALMRFVTPMVAATAGGGGAALAMGAAAALPTGAKMIGRAASGTRSGSGSAGGGSGRPSAATAAPTGAVPSGGKGTAGPAGASGSAGGGSGAMSAGLAGAGKGALAAGPAGAVIAGVSAARGAARVARGAAAQDSGEGNGGPNGSS